MKMANFLLVVFLGLLAAVHSTPISPMLEIPDKSEEDIIQEMQTDGFIVDHPVHTPVNDTGAQNSTSTTKSQVTWNLPSSQTFMFASSMAEGSADTTLPTWTEEGSGQFTATGPSASPTPTTPSTHTPADFASTKSESTTTIQTSHQSFTEVEGSADTTFPTWTKEGSGYAATTDHSTSQTTTSTPTDDVTEGSAETESTTMGRGARLLLRPSDRSTPQATPPTSTTQSPESESTTTTPQTLQAPLTEEAIKGIRHINLESKPDSETSSKATQIQLPNANVDSKLRKGHTTPAWIIILGFIVGLAALIALCAAIATRDKWNGPNQAYEINSNSSTQKRALEKQAFLYKEEPKENGKEAEYTVIPLDELPERYSSD